MHNYGMLDEFLIPPFNLIGASAHFFTYCTSDTSIQLIAEESFDGISSHYTAISSSAGGSVDAEVDAFTESAFGMLQDAPLASESPQTKDFNGAHDNGHDSLPTRPPPGARPTLTTPSDHPTTWLVSIAPRHPPPPPAL